MEFWTTLLKEISDKPKVTVKAKPSKELQKKVLKLPTIILFLPYSQCVKLCFFCTCRGLRKRRNELRTRGPVWARRALRPKDGSCRRPWMRTRRKRLV